jgi:hypothetical protein
MKKNILIITAILFFISAACTITVPIPSVEPGETQTMNINETPAGDENTSKVNIEMNAGSLQLKGEGSGIIEGSIQYNIPEWAPKLTRENNLVTIQQKPGFTIKIPSESVINKWDLSLGKIPVDLSITANAYKGNIDLTDVPVRKLTVKDAASENRIAFNDQNPEVLETLTYTTSASAAELVGLGFANISQMEFNASAGSYILDFSGPLQHPASVKVTGAGCNVKIIIPQGTLSKIQSTGTATSVDITKGNWNVDGNSYSTAGNSPQLDIVVEIGAGRLELAQP